MMIELVRTPSPKKRPPFINVPSVTPVCREEDDARTGRGSFDFVDLLQVGDAHRLAALFIPGLANYQARENLAVPGSAWPAAVSTFWRAARAHDRVDARPEHGSRNTRREVAVANQANAGASGANFVDEPFVPRSIEHDDDQVFDLAVETLGNRAWVLVNGRVEAHGVLRAGPTTSFSMCRSGA